MSEQYWKARAERLGAALRDSVALNKNWVAVAEPDMLEHLSEYKRVITQADEALAQQDDTPRADDGLATKGENARQDAWLVGKGSIPSWASPYTTDPPQPDDERAKALAALDRLRSFTDEDYCESDHARWYDAGLARRYIERLAELEQGVRELADLWESQQAEYPDTDTGKVAAAAVRCCTNELRALLNPPTIREDREEDNRE